MDDRGTSASPDAAQRCSRARRETPSDAKKGVFAGILVGGASSRMGRPKSLVTIAGKAMLDRVAAAFLPYVAEVVLLGAGAVSVNCADLRRLPDVEDVSGPVAGILAAIRWAPDRCWLFSACDQPLLDGSVVAWLMQHRGPRIRAVIPVDDQGRPEPFPGLVEPSGHRLLESLSSHRDQALRHLVGHPGVASPTLPRAIAAKLTNVNSVRDLEALATISAMPIDPARP